MPSNHHLAYTTHDTQATIDFYTRVLGMPLVGAVVDDRIPSTGEPYPYLHTFFRMGVGGADLPHIDRNTMSKMCTAITQKQEDSAMKIGLSGANVGPFIRPALIAQFARDAEQFGFESIWTIEHIVVPKVHAPYHATPDGQIPGGDNLPINEPLMQLSYAAAVTTKLKLATGVLLLPLHHPLYLAKQIATLDQLSNGRLSPHWVPLFYHGETSEWRRKDHEHNSTDQPGSGPRRLQPAVGDP